MLGEEMVKGKTTICTKGNGVQVLRKRFTEKRCTYTMCVPSLPRSIANLSERRHNSSSFT